MVQFYKEVKNIIKKTLSNTNIINPFNDIFKEIEFETLAYCNRKCFYCPNVDFERLGDEASFL